MGRAGILDAYLVRNLDMVEFSFGFTRVSATPTTVQKNLRMPVRLKGFPALQNSRRPIYVIEQQNEALYVRLDPGAVGAFLIANGVLSELPTPPMTLGSQVIEQYEDFGLFMQDFTARDEASRVRARNVPSLVYLLLHTMAHQGHARNRAFLRTRSWFDERGNLPRRSCLPRAPPRHDGRPRQYFLDVARPQ